MRELTLADIQKEISDLRMQVSAGNAHAANLEAIIMMLMARYGDPSHLSVEDAAGLMKRLTGRGSVSTIKRMLKSGELKMEVIPGTKRSGIRVEQIYSRWMPIAAARSALHREQEK